MVSGEALLDLSLSEVVAARVLSLAAVLRDLTAAEHRLVDAGKDLERALSQAGEDAPSVAELELLREHVRQAGADLQTRRAGITVRVEALKNWPELQPLVPELANASDDDPTATLASLDGALSRMTLAPESDIATWVLLESLAATELPK